MSMQFSAKEIRRKAFKKVKEKIDEKDPFAKELARIPNEKFFTSEFMENHVVRGEASLQLAEEVARQRNREKSTLLFLPGEELAGLADDVRSAHKAWKRAAPRPRALFSSAGVYTSITVTRTLGPPLAFQVGRPEISRITYGVAEVGSVPLNGHNELVYAMGHLEIAVGVGSGLADGAESDGEEDAGFAEDDA